MPMEFIGSFWSGRLEITWIIHRRDDECLISSHCVSVLIWCIIRMIFVQNIYIYIYYKHLYSLKVFAHESVRMNLGEI